MSAKIIPLRRPTGTACAAYKRDVAERAYLMVEETYHRSPTPETYFIKLVVGYAREQARKEAE